MLKKFNEVCDLLSVTRDGLRKLMLKDKDFPQPIKLGDTKQAPVYFCSNELEHWLEVKKAERHEVTA
ncbi:AlpA family transcriptional regulator [Acinetobacter sp. Marseille-Q1618]|uniref:helix-turn-helix transcriptional regulator n=1 Tax=Acinetobacter sp. Marseille-Q1618 TaxID=2697502 RepID=UPI00156F2606|nr:AlpA family phage regulatory protein [Acinetobacter sp. Marseille-Q1618]